MFSTHLFSNELIQPACIKLVPVKSISLQQCDEIFYCRPKVPTDRQLLKSEDHVPPSYLPRLPPAEAVTKLRVGKLVETTSCSHTEVAPHIVTATEVKLCYCTTTRSETLHIGMSEIYIICSIDINFLVS